MNSDWARLYYHCRCGVDCPNKPNFIRYFKKWAVTRKSSYPTTSCVSLESATGLFLWLYRTGRFWKQYKNLLHLFSSKTEVGWMSALQTFSKSTSTIWIKPLSLSPVNRLQRIGQYLERRLPRKARGKKRGNGESPLNAYRIIES